MRLRGNIGARDGVAAGPGGGLPSGPASKRCAIASLSRNRSRFAGTCAGSHFVDRSGANYRLECALILSQWMAHTMIYIEGDGWFAGRMLFWPR
jgi:hypothetical protein